MQSVSMENQACAYVYAYYYVTHDGVYISSPYLDMVYWTTFWATRNYLEANHEMHDARSVQEPDPWDRMLRVQQTGICPRCGLEYQEYSIIEHNRGATICYSHDRDNRLCTADWMSEE